MYVSSVQLTAIEGSQQKWATACTTVLKL